MVAAFQDLWRQLDISYDSFIRTTDPKHEVVVADILDRVWQKGDIYKANYNGNLGHFHNYPLAPEALQGTY